MPDLPRPARLSLHDAIGHVAERCKSDPIKAGKAVFYALAEGALIADANVINRYRTPGSLGYVEDGVHPVPTQLWAGYPWQWFKLRAVLPRGNPQYRERTNGSNIGPVYNNPTLATSDIDRWLGNSSKSPQQATAVSPDQSAGAAHEAGGTPKWQTRLGYLPWLETFLDNLPLETKISDDAIAGRFIADIAALKEAGKPVPSRLPQRRNIEVQVSKLWPKIQARRTRPTNSI